MTSLLSHPLLEKARIALGEGGLPRLGRMAWDRSLYPLLLWRDRTWLTRRNMAITLVCRLRRTAVVHVAGDSHTHVLRGVYPFRVTWLGAATAYNLDKEGSTTGSREKLAEALTKVNKSRDVVLLILGEVDARVHIFNQYVAHGRTLSVSELIDATIRRYGAVILRLKSGGYRVVVQSVPAAPYQDNVYGIEFYADNETRARIVREFNGRLKTWCSVNEVEYLDVYGSVSDERGFILRTLTTDGTHLNDSALPIYLDWVRRRAFSGISL